MKELKATRVPPGDRWAIVDGDDQIYASLTEVLNKSSSNFISEPEILLESSELTNFSTLSKF